MDLPKFVENFPKANPKFDWVLDHMKAIENEVCCKSKPSNTKNIIIIGRLLEYLILFVHVSLAKKLLQYFI